MQDMEIAFVSSNKGKVKEAGKILGFELEIVDINLEEIQSLDMAEIVKKKAEAAFMQVGKPLIVDDVGVFFTALNGFPGPFIKYVEEILGYKKFLRILAEEKNREAIVKSAIGYHDGASVHTFIGEVRGIFNKSVKGTEGWGFDPYFVPDGEQRTFAQLGSDYKNEISHRALALRKLKVFLENQ